MSRRHRKSQQGRNKVAHQPPPSHILEKRNRFRIALTIIGFAIFAVVLSVSIIVASLPTKLTETDRAMLRDYDSLRAALARDDLASARNQALHFSTSYPSRQTLAQPAAVLAMSGSLEAARLAFADMSKGGVNLVRKHPEYFIIGCEMETDHCPTTCRPCRTSTYGRWVQLTPEIGNPFMGTSSPTCGVSKVNE